MKPISTPGDLMETINAFRISRLILTAFELNIFDQIPAAGCTSAEVAASVSCDTRATDRLLNALAGTGLISKVSGEFFNTPFAAKFLVSSSPAYMRGLGHYVALWRTWDTLTDSVRSGSSACKSGLTEINDREQEWLEYFIAAMHSRGVAQGRESAAMLDLSRTGRTLDVGGGSGAFTFGLIEKKADIQGVIFDLPAVVPITQKYIDQAGLTSHVSVVAGDYNLDDLGAGFDLVLMSAIIHINNPEENRQLIRKGAMALNPGGQLVIIDFILDESRTQPFTGALFALNMLVGTKHGDSYTADEITTWMEEAGLSGFRLLTAESGMQMMIGFKPGPDGQE
jgi:2-polyprenyl-3-methyl-5-hydroxy-6-metoxy-1,4-benzoquinol methylase